MTVHLQPSEEQFPAANFGADAAPSQQLAAKAATAAVGALYIPPSSGLREGTPAFAGHTMQKISPQGTLVPGPVVMPGPSLPATPPPAGTEGRREPTNSGAQYSGYGSGSASSALQVGGQFGMFALDAPPVFQTTEKRPQLRGYTASPDPVCQLQAPADPLPPKTEEKSCLEECCETVCCVFDFFMKANEDQKNSKK